jgi:molybdopterin converting factor small subunit
MDIEVMLFGKLRELGGVSKEIVAIDDAGKLAGLIAILGEKHGLKFAEEVAATRELRILVNGREYQLLGGIETQLMDKDTVVLLPPIEGG